MTTCPNNDHTRAQQRQQRDRARRDTGVIGCGRGPAT
jgi:hypothetical protein